jgi:5-methylcytosine-specific restriction endonuclease McrA
MNYGLNSDLTQGNVLVLNRSWIAIHVTPARRALSLLYAGTARAVHPTVYSLHGFEDWLVLSQNGLGGRYVRTPSLRIRIPEVVLLNAFNGFVRREVPFSRQSIYERDRNICQYCGKSFSRPRLTIDHVVPQSRGGLDTWDNLVVACLKCNVRKGSRTPDEAEMPLVRRPRKPAWFPHLGARLPMDLLEIWGRFIEVPA